MKPTELMIGDWVYNTHNRQNEQVAEIGSGLVMLAYNDLYEYDEIEPSPLTPEILEGNGFEHSIDDEDRYSFEDTTIIFKHDTEYLFSASVNGSNGMLYLCANYVHELQQALKICGLNELADNFKVEE